MFCPKCGKQLMDNSKFCNSCGASTELQGTQPKLPNNNPIPQVIMKGAISQWKDSNTPVNPTPGIFMTVIGAIMLLYMLFTIHDEKGRILGGYTYTPPFTDHEVAILGIGFIGIILLVFGFINLSAYFSKKK